MPAKRTRIPRELRIPRFSSEVLALFFELESMRDQHSRSFEEGSQRLASWLHLGAEFLCSGSFVNDKSADHHWPNDDYPAAQDWIRVHQIRQQLLAAVAAATAPNGHHHGSTLHERRATNHIRPDHDDAADHSITLAAAAFAHPGVKS